MNINKVYISCIVFLQISFCFLFVDIYVREDVWTLASHLHVFCFQLEAGVKGLGLGGVKFLGIVGWGKGGGGLPFLGYFYRFRGIFVRRVSTTSSCYHTKFSENDLSAAL